MYFSYRQHLLSVSKQENKNNLIEFLNTCSSGKLLLGIDSQEENDFYSILFYLNGNISEKFGVGIISEGHGIEPHILLMPSMEKILIGFNSNVIAIDCNYKYQLFKIILNSLFRCFIYLEQYKIILVLHEVGVVAISENGEELWRYDGDVIDSYNLNEQEINFLFIDDTSISLRLLNGKIVD